MSAPDPDFIRRRNARSKVTALLLVAMMILFYAITYVKLHHS
jgi:hypothetical protein